MMLFARDVMRGGNYGAHRSRECERATALGGQIACDLAIVWVRMIGARRQENVSHKETKLQRERFLLAPEARRDRLALRAGGSGFVALFLCVRFSF